MATQRTADAALEFWEAGDRNWHVQYANTCEALDALNAVGDLAVTLPSAERPTSTTLNVRVAAGSFRKADGTIGTYAGTATQLLTASSTNYLFLTDAGALTVNTTGFPATTDIVRLAVAVTDTTTVTSIADSRVPWTSSGLGPSGTFVQTYSTADATLSAYTPDVENVAYTGAADSEAKLADLNALRVAYENLRLFTEDLANFVNSLVDALQARGTLG